MKINDDVRILGKLTVDKLDGLFVADLHNQDERLQALFDNLAQQLTEQKTCIDMLTDSYNKAIEVINDLSERVTALESNYDPTVIK